MIEQVATLLEFLLNFIIKAVDIVPLGIGLHGGEIGCDWTIKGLDAVGFVDDLGVGEVGITVLHVMT